MSEKKAIRIQVDMIYNVPANVAADVFDFDINFFKELEEAFNNWDANPKEVRSPVKFELRHHVGDVQPEKNP